MCICKFCCWQLFLLISLISSITTNHYHHPDDENVKNLKCFPCSQLKGPCKRPRVYEDPHLRPKNEIVLVLNLPFKLDFKGIEHMTGDHGNTGKHYASAAYVAAEDINR